MSHLVPSGALRIGAGIYSRDGEMYVDAAEMLAARGFEPTPENQQQLERIARQVAEEEGVEFHDTELVTGLFGVPSCRICHCTDELACPDGCEWIEDPVGQGDLCSSCRELAVALEQISEAIGQACRPLSARELATHTGIDFLALASAAGPTGASTLDELVGCGHLHVVDGDPRRYGLRGEAAA